jgi:N-acetylglutamate synthase-like GNAT family acetyltransferase
MFVVRRATEDDVEAIGRVHRRSIREICGAHYPPEVIEAWAAPRRPEHYSKAVRNKDFYVAEDAEGAVVGFGVLNRETQEVEAVYVQPEVKRRGAGMKILRTLEDVARGAGLETLHLNASLNGVPFYEGAGYAWLEQGAHRLANGVEIACVLMSKSLTEETGGAEGD